MFLLLIILVGGYIVYRLLQPRSYNSANYGGSGMGSMFGGMMLGYLLSNYLIDQHQYDMWRNLDEDQLRDTLTSQGILNDADYDNLANQATAGMLPGYEDTNDGMSWTNANSDYSSNTDSYDDFGGGDDFGGFDS